MKTIAVSLIIYLLVAANIYSQESGLSVRQLDSAYISRFPIAVAMNERAAFALVPNFYENEVSTLFIYDLTFPNTIKLAYEYHHEAMQYNLGVEGGPTYSLAINGDVLYLPVQGGFDALDVSDLHSPAVVHAYRSDELGDGGVSGSMLVHGDKMIIVRDWCCTLETLDVSDPASPTRQGVASLPDDELMQLVWDGGGYAYVLSGIGRGMGPEGRWISVIDVTNFSQPVVVKTIDIVAQTLLKIDNVLIAIGSENLETPESTVHLLDVSNPAQPIEIDSYDIEQSIGKLYPIGNLLIGRNNWIGQQEVYQWIDNRIKKIYAIPEQYRVGDIAVSRNRYVGAYYKGTIDNVKMYLYALIGQSAASPAFLNSK